MSGTTTITVESQASSEIQQCMAIDAALAAAARQACEGGDVPVVFSGNCHACLGSLAGIGGPAAIVWFDAHGDLNTPETTETGYFDGMGSPRTDGAPNRPADSRLRRRGERDVCWPADANRSRRRVR